MKIFAPKLSHLALAVSAFLAASLASASTYSFRVSASGIKQAPTWAVSGSPALAFAPTYIGSDAASNITVPLTNSGGIGTLGALTFSGANANEYFATNNCNAVGTGGACSVSVRYHPLAAGAGSATLNVGNTALNFTGTGLLSATSITINGGTSVDLRTAALNAGWNGTRALIATISADLGATRFGAPALTIQGSFPSGVSVIINSGVYVVGAGGYPATGGTSYAGGTAMVVSTPVSITNNGVIGGGGGGGGGYYGTYYGTGGGGAGLPNGGGYGGQSVSHGGMSGGSVAGGAAGSPGADKTSATPGSGGGGGGLGAPGGYGSTGAGGAAGAATNGNSYITWTVRGTVYGPLN